MSAHGGDCDGTWCDFCGCCEHGEARDGIGCRAADAPSGMRCPGSYCGCEGVMGHQKPTQPPEADPDAPEPQPEPEDGIMPPPMFELTGAVYS